MRFFVISVSSNNIDTELDFVEYLFTVQNEIDSIFIVFRSQEMLLSILVRAKIIIQL